MPGVRKAGEVGMMREEVIKGLEQFIADFKPFCGNKADWQRVDDAIALLKAQEARVMTLADALAADYVYLEIRLHASLPCNCCILAVDPDGGILPLHKGFCAYLDGEDYGIDWRCWTSRPTDEQRGAVKWE